MVWYILAVVVASAFIASLLVPGGLSSQGNLGAVGTRINTGGPTALLPDDGRDHVEPGQAHKAYSSKPATSGPHWSSAPVAGAPDGAPVRWGIYDHALADEALVHNLEHGGIGLHYDCPEGCPELVDQLKSIPPASYAQFIVAPYPDMQHRIAITSWRHLLFLDEFDEARIREFVEAYQDRAPESVPGNQF
jgi:hypothetical protein